MTDFRYYSKSFLREFIELYKSEPSLWKIQSSEYKDRRLKDKSYEKLIQKLREVDPNADRTAVLKKINSFRTCFRKEYKKTRTLLRAGHSYKPNLWYFDLLLFLTEKGNDSNEDRTNSNDYYEEVTNDRFEYVKMENLTDNEDITMEENTEVWGNHPEDNNLEAHFSPEHERDGSNSNLRIPNRSIQSNSTSYINAVPSRPTGVNEDEYDYIGKNVAAKLRRLPPKMKIISEKLINDVLYQAQLDNLNVNSFIEINNKSISLTQDSCSVAK